MNAVAMMTPVPKCFTEKNIHDGIRRLLARFAIIGNNTPEQNQLLIVWVIPNVEVSNIAKSAAMCNLNSNSWTLSTSASVSQVGLCPW